MKINYSKFQLVHWQHVEHLSIGKFHQNMSHLIMKLPPEWGSEGGSKNGAEHQPSELA